VKTEKTEGGGENLFRSFYRSEFLIPLVSVVVLPACCSDDKTREKSWERSGPRQKKFFKKIVNRANDEMTN
jgi:hypothetical protein